MPSLNARLQPERKSMSTDSTRLPRHNGRVRPRAEVPPQRFWRVLVAAARARDRWATGTTGGRGEGCAVRSATRLRPAARRSPAASPCAALGLGVAGERPTLAHVARGDFRGLQRGSCAHAGRCGDQHRAPRLRPDASPHLVARNAIMPPTSANTPRMDRMILMAS